MTSSNAARTQQEEPATVAQKGPKNPHGPESKVADPLRALVRDALKGARGRAVESAIDQAYHAQRKERYGVDLISTDTPAAELAMKLSRARLAEILRANGVEVPAEALKFQPPVPQKDRKGERKEGKPTSKSSTAAPAAKVTPVVAKAAPEVDPAAPKAAGVGAGHVQPAPKPAPKAPEALTGEGSSRTTFGEALKRTADGGKLEGFVAQWRKYQARVAGEDQARTAAAKGVSFASPEEKAAVLTAGSALAQALEAKKPQSELEAARAAFNAVAVPIKQRKTAPVSEPATAQVAIPVPVKVSKKGGPEEPKKATGPSAANLKEGVSEAYRRTAKAWEHDHPEEFRKALKTYAERVRRFMAKLDAEVAALADTETLATAARNEGKAAVVTKEQIAAEREKKDKFRPNPKVTAAIEKLLAAIDREAPTSELVTLFEALEKAKEEKAGILKLVPEKAVRRSGITAKDEFDKASRGRPRMEEGRFRPERGGYTRLLSPRELSQKLRSLESLKAATQRLESERKASKIRKVQATDRLARGTINQAEFDQTVADLARLDSEIKENGQLIADSEKTLRTAKAKIQAALAERVIRVDGKPYRLAELRVARSAIRGGLAVLHGVAMGEKGNADHRLQYEWNCTPENYRSMGLTLGTIRDFATGSPDDIHAFVAEAGKILDQEREDAEYDRQEALGKVHIYNLPVQDLRFGHTSENRVFHEHGRNRGKAGVQLTVYYGQPVSKGGTGKWSIQTFRSGDPLPAGLTPEVLRLAKGAEQYADAWLREARSEFRPPEKEAERFYEFAKTPSVVTEGRKKKFFAERLKKQGHSRSNTRARSYLMEETKKQMEAIKWNKRVARRGQEVEASLRAVDPSIAQLIDAYKKLLKTKETITNLDQIEAGLTRLDKDDTRVESALALLGIVKSAKATFEAASRADYNEAVERLEKTQKRQRRQK